MYAYTFPITRKGYDKEEVEHFISILNNKNTELEDEIRKLKTQLEKQEEQFDILLKQKKEISENLEQFQYPSYEGVGTNISKIFSLIEKEKRELEEKLNKEREQLTEELLQKNKKDYDKLIEKAEKRAYEIKSTVEKLYKQAQEEKLLHEKELSEKQKIAEEENRQLYNETAQKCIEREKEFEKNLEEKRSEFLDHIEKIRLLITEMENLKDNALKDAGEKAKAIFSRIEKEVTDLLEGANGDIKKLKEESFNDLAELKEKHKKISQQLKGVKDMLSNISNSSKEK